jgi:hypothetical protein
MKIYILTVIIAFCFLVTGCEKSSEKISSFENSTFNAEITGFVAEKCFCCWGWQIKIGDQFIKADLLPDVSLIGHEINSPVPVIIETGARKIKCTGMPDYYEIKSLTLKK